MLFNTFIILFLLGCSDKSASISDKSPALESAKVSYEKFMDERITLTLSESAEKNSSSVVSLHISYTGKTGVEKTFKENQNLILDLIRTKAVNYSLKDLRKGDNLTRFENEILESINGFVANDMFVKVQVSKIKEI